MVRAQPQLSDIPVEGSPDKVSDSDHSAVVKGSPVVELSFPPKAPEDMFDVVKHMIFKNPANRSAAVIPESELRAAVNKQLQEVLNWLYSLKTQLMEPATFLLPNESPKFPNEIQEVTF